MTSVVAIVLARGGSKGIPGKNIKDFCGQPLVSWTIQQAIQSNEIDKVFLTSDSEEILTIGKDYGAELIRRPEEFASDEASSESAVLHALSTFKKEPEIIVMLEPTAPLRKIDDLSNAVNQFKAEGWDSAFSGSLQECFLLWERDYEGNLNSINYDYTSKVIRRQDRKDNFHENGAVYIFKPDILRMNNRFGGKIGIYLMEPWQQFEIDTPQEWIFCEDVFRKHILDA